MINMTVLDTTFPGEHESNCLSTGFYLHVGVNIWVWYNTNLFLSSDDFCHSFWNSCESRPLDKFYT